ncbi:MAG: hypothetical protein JNM69_27480 [Archangium sp.]|nr:hypothetical protein [Archangium sp.]
MSADSNPAAPLLGFVAGVAAAGVGPLVAWQGCVALDVPLTAWLMVPVTAGLLFGQWMFVGVARLVGGSWQTKTTVPRDDWKIWVSVSAFEAKRKVLFAAVGPLVTASIAIAGSYAKLKLT